MLPVKQWADPRFYPGEPTLPNSNLSWYHAGSLKSAMEEVFPHKLENTIYQDFFFSSEKHLSAQHWFKYFIYINLFNPHNLSNLHAHKNRKLNHREIK